MLKPPCVLLEDRVGLLGGRIYARPVEAVRCDEPQGFDAALERLQAALDAGLHVAGFLAYEAAHMLEPRLGGIEAGPRPEPLLWFGIFDGFRPVTAIALDAFFGEMPPLRPLTEVRPGRSREQHTAKVEAVKTLIGAGDVYQVNLTFPIDFRSDNDPLALYAALRASQPVAHGGVVALRDCTVVSVSPELFVSVRDGRALTRPMKGTAARGADAVADQEAQRRLLSDPKQRAENLMIVDLLRNDLSRICRPGTVRTPALFAVESYPTFHALTSTVTGDLRTGIRLPELLRALFPCGSVVGAPKVRAGEIIRDIEGARRGVYTGAIGAISPGGDLAFNVAIRTAVIGPGGFGRYGVGGGIVADSDPDAEYEEALLKGRVLTDLAESFSLVETLRWRPEEGYVRVKDHLARLAASADTLRFPFDRAGLEARLAVTAEAWNRSQDRRVRLLLAQDGKFEISGEPLNEEPQGRLAFGVFPGRLDAADPFLRHKTTRRATHDAASLAAAAAGLDEMILLNRCGCLADGSRNSIFIERQGRLITPPLTAGALPGVLRSSLIAQGAAIEADLTVDDLRSGPAFLGNSLRGLRRADLLKP
jgi:para-aminobenzoate synthetase/4-amino-4-deoxychorismate lyase